MHRLLILFLLAAGCSTAQNEIAEYSEHGVRFVRLHAGAVGQIHLVFKDEQGKRYSSLNSSSKALDEGELLMFATNGGMFHRDGNPVGLRERLIPTYTVTAITITTTTSLSLSLARHSECKRCCGDQDWSEAVL